MRRWRGARAWYGICAFELLAGAWSVWRGMAFALSLAAFGCIGAFVLGRRAAHLAREDDAEVRALRAAIEQYERDGRAR